MARRLPIGLVALALVVACKESPDPTGSHKVPLATRFEPEPPGTPPTGAVPTTFVVTDEGSGVYKATFGECWFKMKRPKQPPQWTVTEGSDCKTSLGTVRITGGFVDVDERGALYVFEAQGFTPDRKTTVKWAGAELKRTP